jgi:hypothetical protein
MPPPSLSLYWAPTQKPRLSGALEWAVKDSNLQPWD